MYRYLLILLIFLLPLISSGQAGNDLILGGSIGISHDQRTEQSEVVRNVVVPGFPFTQPQTFIEEVEITNTQVSCLPYLGKIISPNLTIGLGVDLSFGWHTRIFNGSENTDKTSYVGGRFLLRYTINPANRLRAYVEPSLGYGIGRNRLLSRSGATSFFGDKTNQLSFYSGFGATYELSPRLQANFRLGGLYARRIKWEDDNGRTSGEDFGVGLDFRPQSVFFGVEFFL